MEFKLSKFLNRFKLECLHLPKNHTIEDFTFKAISISNGAYQMLGYSQQDTKIIIMGGQDYDCLKSFENEKLEECFSNLKKLNIPLLILSRDFDWNLIKDYVQDANFPICHSQYDRNNVVSKISHYVNIKTSEEIRVHGTLMNVFGEGVLITGESGIGKSEVALDLISKNHMFVGDDAIDLLEISDTILGKPAKATKNYMEVRGIGIVNIQRMFGPRIYLRESYVDLIIKLVPYDKNKEYERLGKEYKTKKIKNTSIPYIEIPISTGKIISILIESAVINFKLYKYEKYHVLNKIKK